MRAMLVLFAMILRGGILRAAAFIFVFFCLLALYAVTR